MGSVYYQYCAFQAPFEHRHGFQFMCVFYFCHRFVSLCVCVGCIHESVGVHTCLHVQKPEQDVLGVLCLSLPFPLRQSLTEVGAHHFQLG